MSATLTDVTRIGRFVAGVGAAVLGLVVTVAYFWALDAFGPEPGSVGAILLFVAGFAIFGIVAAALYTWAVNGPFVRSATSRRAPRGGPSGLTER